MARDTLAEIAEKQARAGRFYRSYSSELTTIDQGWLGGDGPLSVAPEFVIIRLVTILEVFTRSWLAEIIDAGEPYLTRAAKLVGNDLKFNFAVAQALVRQHVTFGDLVSHTVAVNRLGDIVGIFSSMLDDDLFHVITGVADRWKVEICGEPAVPIIDNVERVKSNLAHLFERRHVLVHELPIERNTSRDETTGLLVATLQFVQACEQAFSTLLQPDYPLTQTDMNMRAGEAAAVADAELNSVLGQLDPKGTDAQLAATQAAWENFRALQSEFRSGINKPGRGSIAPLLHSSEWESLTRKRIDELRWYIEREEGDM